MNQTPPVWLPPEVADKVFGNVEIAVQDPGVVSNRAGPQHVGQDRKYRSLRRLPMVH